MVWSLRWSLVYSWSLQTETDSTIFGTEYYIIYFKSKLNEIIQQWEVFWMQYIYLCYLTLKNVPIYIIIAGTIGYLSLRRHTLLKHHLYGCRRNVKHTMLLWMKLCNFRLSAPSKNRVEHRISLVYIKYNLLKKGVNTAALKWMYWVGLLHKANISFIDF